MNYKLLQEILQLAEIFENETNTTDQNPKNIENFKNWIIKKNHSHHNIEPNWEGKNNGRSAESVISTLLVHLNRFAKNYSKSAIYESEFSTQEEFIYLINLKAFGEMSKIQLIKKNIHDKPIGMQVIRRIIDQGWASQINSNIDKRSKIIAITQKGEKILEQQMDKIRSATQIVSGNLTQNEKFELIRLLNKLNEFHSPIFHQNFSQEELLQKAKEYNAISQN